MLLSRFWTVLLTLALGAATFSLFVAQQMYNHASARAMSLALSSDSSAVEWYLRDESRKREAELIRFALSPEIGDGLNKANSDAKVDRETRAKVKAALNKLAGEVATDAKFDAVWAVDANGRVIASVGFDHNEDWDLGGYSSVADALHGWIRDDAWVWKGRIYRIVTRPVEREAQGEPVGAIVGARMVDDTFARAVTKRTGAAVGFYADGARVASGAPEGFDKANLDEITRDLKGLETDKDYLEKGRSEVRVLGEHLGVVYARLPGEAWELGAGYAVGHLAMSVTSPLSFAGDADNTDKEKVPTKTLIVVVVLLIGLGMALSYVEYNGPLNTFRSEALRLAKGEIEVFSPSRFRGAYKKVAADINDGMEKVAAKGGGSRRADLEQVLGPIPQQPAMSAFSVPSGGPPPPVEPSVRPAPRPPPAADRNAPRLRQPETSGPTSAEPVEAPVISEPSATPQGTAHKPPPVPPKRTPPAPTPTTAPSAETQVFNELDDWRRVYEEFLALKKQCGEDYASLTFEKFKGTLQRNKDALVQRHGCERVKFTVYVKEGKAALKASPVK